MPLARIRNAGIYQKYRQLMHTLELAKEAEAYDTRMGAGRSQRLERLG